MNSENSNVFYVDPGSPRVPEGLSAPPREAGEVILLLADEEAREAGWAPTLAIGVARSWASSGLHVLLADGDLAGASLHDRVGLENEEGLSDLVRFGVSPARVAHAVAGGGFQFISAGTAVGDPEELYRHDRWAPLLAAFRESGTILLLYLPSGAPGVDYLVDEGDRVIRLTGNADAQESDPGTITVLGVAEVPRETGGDHEPLEQGAHSRTDAPPLDGIPERSNVDPELGAPAPAIIGTPPAEREPEPVPARTTPPPKPRRPRTLWIVLALVALLVALLVAVLVAARLGYVQIPGVTPTITASLLGIFSPSPKSSANPG